MKFFAVCVTTLSMILGSMAIAAEKKAPVESKAKTETKAEVKKEAKPEAKPEVKAEAKPEAKEQPKAVEAKPAANPESMVVKVNGTTIKEKDISVEIEKRMGAQMARMTAMGWPMSDDMKQNMRDQMRDGIADMLVEKQLISEQLKANKIEVSAADVDARFEEMIKETGKKPEEIEQELSKMGMTIKDIKEQVQWQLGIEKLFEANSKDAKVTEEEAKKFYEENKASFDQPEQVQASHILIKVEQNADEAAKKAAKTKCEDILKKVKAGGDFAALAKENSDCPSKERGGDLGLFGRGQMVKPFEDAAFGMKVGDVSDIVETQFGYHIIKLVDRKAAQSKTFDDVKKQIMSNLKMKKLNEYWTKTRQELKDKAKLEWSPEEKARRDKKAEEAKKAMEVPAQPQPQSEK